MLVLLRHSALAAAVTIALRKIEAVGVSVLSVQSEDLVSLKDIATRIGRTYESVRKLANGERGPSGFPISTSNGQWALYSWDILPIPSERASMAQLLTA